MRKKMRQLTIILLTIVLVGCDTFYHIPINGQTDEFKVSIDCGTLKVRMINWQGHSFDFYQDYDFNEPVTFYSDSIKAYWKDQTFPLTFIAQSPGNQESLTIKGKGGIRTAFHIQQRVKKGDTITVVPNGYIYCNKRKVNLDTLELIINEDLNAPMDNMFGKNK